MTPNGVYQQVKPLGKQLAAAYIVQRYQNKVEPYDILERDYWNDKNDTSKPRTKLRNICDDIQTMWKGRMSLQEYFLKAQEALKSYSQTRPKMKVKHDAKLKQVQDVMTAAPEQPGTTSGDVYQGATVPGSSTSVDACPDDLSSYRPSELALRLAPDDVGMQWQIDKTVFIHPANNSAIATILRKAQKDETWFNDKKNVYEKWPGHRFRWDRDRAYRNRMIDKGTPRDLYWWTQDHEQGDPIDKTDDDQPPQLSSQKAASSARQRQEANAKRTADDENAQASGIPSTNQRKKQRRREKAASGC